MVYPSLSAFFYIRPTLMCPYGDSRFVALGSPFYRLLVAQTHFPQQFAHMLRMVAYSELASDYIAYPSAGPYITPKPVCFGSLRQQLRYLLSLFLTQFGSRSWRRMAGQTFFTFLLHPFEPLTDGPFAYPQGMR